MDTPFSHETRARNIAQQATEPFDLLVIGAGAVGAGIARDAAMRGVRTALVDKGDFGSGTSSRSSRLIHGGLRYLEHGHFRLVFEASRERRVLLKIAPHLVRPSPFLLPIYDGARIARRRLTAGLWLYDLLACFRNVGRHRRLGKQAVLRAEPRLKERGLIGGASYFDARCDDARLTLATVRAAHRYGAVAANYLQVNRLEIADGRVRGAHTTDLVTGEDHTIRALAVVNATGPWSDIIRTHEGGTPVLRPTKGVHVVVPRHRVGNEGALTILSPIDGRVMFIVPWDDLAYIGTTDTDTAASPDDCHAEGAEVIYLLRSANALFPDARLSPDDVVATWAGVRPLVAPQSASPTSSVSREHRILERADGLLSVVGGTLTTHRAIAAEAVDRVCQTLHHLDGRAIPPAARTEREPLPGGEAHDLEVLVEGAERDGLPPETARHLVYTYGSETPAVIRLAQGEPHLAEPIVPEHPTIVAELIHAIRREMAITLGDLLIRRTHLFYQAPDQLANQVYRVAEIASTEMHWDADRRAAELRAYEYEIDRNMAFRGELEGLVD